MLANDNLRRIPISIVKVHRQYIASISPKSPSHIIFLDFTTNNRCDVESELVLYILEFH
jgi:hypothetical protein